MEYVASMNLLLTVGRRYVVANRNLEIICH